MLGTGTSLNSGEVGVTLAEERIATGPEISNIPLSPEVQSRLLSRSDLERDGYDSDASVNPYAEVADEGPLEVDEPPLQEVGNGDTPLGVVQEDTEIGCFVDIPPEKLAKMKVSELKHELSIRGQPVGGKKVVLLERLKTALFQQCAIQSTNNNPQQTTDNLSGFSPDAKWRPLVALEEAVEEPDNAAPLMHAPTIPVEDAEFVPQKHNFAERFDRECFVGTEKVPKLHRNGVPVRVNGKQQMEERVTTVGGPKADFLLEKGLNESSKPQEWFNAFLPIFDGKGKNPQNVNTQFWTHKWAFWTNQKAISCSAGVPGGVYPSFTPFSYLEIERFLGLYILQGLNPSPQVEMKFNSQQVDPVQGNDLCYRIFGANAVVRYKQFKAFFCVQDPSKIPPNRKERPMYKVDSILKHTQVVSMKAWRLGRDISGDEQTIGFQGKHEDKLRITYKAEGDGFQCDAICDSGFTWTFYFRNQKAPREWTSKGFSPLHARILRMFDQFEMKFHNCWFDNLYLSARFARAAYVHKQKIRISGPTRKSGCGLPSCVLQEEKKTPNEIRAVRGTVKAAVLDGDPDVPNLVAVSYYDQKPVHFLSTICESIHWIQCQKQVYCSETQQLETLKFLRLNVNNDYNHDMGGVDIADQLRNYYRFDHWMRKRKWWWSIFFWAFGVLLVNAYVSYKTYMISKGKRPMSHYEFRKQIALAWIDPTTYWKDRMKNNQQKKPPTTCSTETESRPSRKRSQSVSVASAQSIGGGEKESNSCQRQYALPKDRIIAPSVECP